MTISSSKDSVARSPIGFRVPQTKHDEERELRGERHLLQVVSAHEAGAGQIGGGIEQREHGAAVRQVGQALEAGIHRDRG